MSDREIIQYYINKRFRWCNDYNCYVSRYINPAIYEGWYREARKVYLLKMTFEDFKFMVHNNVFYPPRKRTGFWREKKQKSRFTKKDHHKKKVLSEDDVRKKEWRKKKKRQSSCEEKGWFYHGSKKFYKNTANRNERRTVKHKIKKANYDWDNYSHKRKGEFFDWRDYY